MSQAANLYVLDTSAWLTLIEDAAGAERVQALLERAQGGEMVVLTSCMSCMAVYDITMQERGPDEAQERVKFLAS